LFQIFCLGLFKAFVGRVPAGRPQRAPRNESRARRAIAQAHGSGTEFDVDCRQDDAMMMLQADFPTYSKNNTSSGECQIEKTRQCLLKLKEARAIEAARTALAVMVC
jgi:hypothetical protein